MALSFAAAAGIAAIVSLIAGTGLDHIQRKTDREFAASEAQKQRDWETQMSNTAVQRQVKDMQAAGINPAMAYAGSASGASTPSGAAAHTNAAGSNHNIGSVLSGMANVAHVMNNDKNNKNDIDISDAIGMLSNVAGVLGYK